MAPPIIIEYDRTTSGAAILSRFRKKHGSLKQLRQRVKSGKGTFRDFVDLEEWEVYLRPGRAKGKVREGRTGIFQDAREFFRVFTTQRLLVLDALRAPGADYGSVHELARALGRDPKNVLNDLKALQQHDLVTLEKRNARRSVPRAAVERVIITM